MIDATTACDIARRLREEPTTVSLDESAELSRYNAAQNPQPLGIWSLPTFKWAWEGDARDRRA